MRPARVQKTARRLLTTVLVAGAVTLSTTTPATAMSATRTTAAHARQHPAMAPSTYEKRVQRWVNAQRRNHDLGRLRFARCPDRSAERWSSFLARQGEFYHQSMQDLLERCHAVYAGETLGRGAVTPRRLVRMWMDSDGHREILLSSDSRRIGIGAKPDSQGRWVVAANFVRF